MFQDKLRDLCFTSAEEAVEPLKNEIKNYGQKIVKKIFKIGFHGCNGIGTVNK